MDIKIILLIGIVYLAKSVLADGIFNEKIIGEDGEPVRCGTKWKPEDGVKYKIYYGPQDQGGEEEGDEEDAEARSTKPSISSPEASGLAETDNEIHDVYEYCINEKTKLVMYTNYEIKDPGLMKPIERTYERQYSSVSGPYEKQVSDATKFLRKSDSQKFYENVIDYDSQMVAIPDFIPDIEIQKAFYEYDIAAPMNLELTKPWEEVIKEIKSKIYKIQEPIHVFSGTYDTYRLHGVSKYIIPSEHILPVPFAWWILMYNKTETRGVSVIMQNYAFSPREEKYLLCTEEVCSDIGLNIPKYNRAHIYCCPAETILEEYPFTEAKIDKLFFFNRK